MAKAAKAKRAKGELLPGQAPKHPTTLPPLPYSIRDRGSILRKAWVVCEKMGKEYVGAAFFDITTNLIDVCAIGVHEIDPSYIGTKQFHVDTGFGSPERVYQTHVQWLKNWALKNGATPDAIRLLKLVTDVTAKDEKEMSMAEKATKAKASNKVAKKAKGADAPVGGGGKAAKANGKGNAEALAKARAARAENAGPDTRKIKIVNKENPYREGSNRAASFAALKGAKTVEDYKSAGGKTKYLSRWAEEGRIELGA